MNKKNFISLLLSFVGIINCIAQPTDTLIYQLNTLIFEESRSNTFDSIATSIRVNTTNYQSNSLGEALNNSQSLYINNNSPSGLITVSVRGTGTSHIVPIWNGISLMSSMNGVTDLQLFPVFFLDEVQLIKGGSSTLFGSGNLGGRIEMNSNTNNSSDATVLLGANSMNNLSTGLKINLQSKNKKLNSATKFYYKNAKNNYAIPQTKPKFIVKNSPYSQLSALQSFAYQINNKTKLKSNIWWIQNKRELPLSLFATQDLSNQTDESLRAVLSLKKLHKHSSTQLKSAFVTEHILYYVANELKGNNLAYNTVFEVEHINYINNNNVIGLLANHSYYSSKTLNYDFLIHQNRVSINAFYKYHSKNKKLLLNTAIKQELIDDELVPIIPSVAVQYQFKHILFTTNHSRSFRYPTFNDLYWNPGGNVNLKPEKGWTNDIGIKIITNHKKRVQLSISSQLFSNIADNWIKWVPNGQTSKAENNLKVWARGIESNIDIQTKISTNHALNLNISITKQKTTHIASYNNQEYIIGKQLIFTPMELGSISLKWLVKKYEFMIQNNYTGLRFTTATNTKFLDAFSLTNLHINKAFQFNKYQVKLQFSANNLFNTKYELYPSRTLPGSNFQLNIFLSTAFKNKINK